MAVESAKEVKDGIYTYYLTYLNNLFWLGRVEYQLPMHTNPAPSNYILHSLKNHTLVCRSGVTISS